MYSYANGNVCSHVICHTYLILRDHEKKALFPNEK